MPRSTNDVVVGSGARPPQECASNLSTQGTIIGEASQISAANPFGTYLGDDAQSHFDDLAGQVALRPPFLGEQTVSFTFGALSSSVSGVPDWGVLKQADSPIWERSGSIGFDGLTALAADFRLPAADTFLYNRVNPLPLGDDGADPRTDSVFNIVNPALLGGGQGASFLSGRMGDATVNSGQPNHLRDFRARHLLPSERRHRKRRLHYFWVLIPRRQRHARAHTLELRHRSYAHPCRERRRNKRKSHSRS